MSKGQPPDWAIRTKADLLALDQGAYWDETRAMEIVAFAHAFFKPTKVKGKFRLQKWQRRFLQSLVSWRWPDGRRRWRYGSLHISKKNGKTLLVSILCLYELLASGEPSPTVYAAAASKENAEQIFNEVKYSIERSPFKAHCRIANHLKRIVVPSLNARFRTYASRGDSVHGDPANLVVVDEGHVVGQDLKNALIYNSDATPDGLFLVISTAGSDTSHWYYQTYEKSKRILSGEDLDTITYAEVYEADSESDYERDETQWLRANPSMGISFPIDQFRRQLQSARGNLGEWINAKKMKLNIWTRADETAWLDVSDYSRYTKDIPDEQLRECRCVLGCDLSQTIDPSSVSAIWDLGDKNYHVKSWAFVAEAGIEFRSKGSLPKFAEFIESGSMRVTPGDMIDAATIREHILDLCKTYQVASVNFDPNSAYMMANDIESEGYTTQRMPQTFRHFSGPMNEFSRAWREGRISHDGSSWLRYTLSNVRVEINKYNEIAPRKKRCPDSIDGAVACLLGYASFIEGDKDTITTGMSWI